MSALLKSTQVVGTLPLARTIVSEPMADPREVVIAALREEIVQLQAAAARMAAEQDARVADAAAQAERKTREAMRRDDAARTAVLEKALRAARTGLDERLALLDRLAPALARMALDRLFAASADWVARVEAMIARRLEVFRRETVVAVAVSTADVEEAGLAELGARLNGMTVRHDPALTAGQCRIEARCEILPLDLATEWATLATALDAMVEGRA